MAKRTPTLKELYDSLPMSSDITKLVHTYLGTPFIVVLNITSVRKVVISRIESTEGVFIDWGDGKKGFLGYLGANVRHVYSEPGTYVVQFLGDITYVNFSNINELAEISQWGGIKLLSGYNSFKDCRNLNITSVDQPNLTLARPLAGMFNGCDSLDCDLSRWDVSNVVNMDSMFFGCKNFNSDLSKWNVGNVRNMSMMFARCKSFSSDLSGWNVSKVTDMCGMFTYCSKFSSDLSEWNVSKVKNMCGLFSYCEMFESDLSKWNTENATDIGSMFNTCKLFKSNLSRWNVSNVTNMGFMFRGCDNFNSDLS